MFFRKQWAIAILSGAIATPLHAVPENPFLAESSWPLFHRNNYAQASGQLTSISASDRLAFKRVDNPNGGTSPWTITAAPYSDGTQAILGSVQGGVVKWLIDGENFDEISYLPLPRGRFDFDWYLTALANGEFVTTSIRENSLYLLRDERPECPRCRLVIDRKIKVPRQLGELTIHFSVAYDGNIIILLKDNKIAAISPSSGRVLAIGSLGAAAGYSYHNAFAIDENNRIHVTSQTGVIAIDWTGHTFKPAWQASYDFRGPDCKKPRRQSRFRERLRTIRGKTCTGTGTTPTLLGTPEEGVVVMVDGHAPKNHLIAFWRGDVPKEATRYPEESPRLADRIALPLSTPLGEGHTAENSPAVLGHSIFVAQWAGFNPDCTPPKGVQRVDWNPATGKLQLVWANPNVHFNGIPTVSSRTGLVYGTGRGNGCEYAYRGLDIATGSLKLDVPLSTSKGYTDQGNQQTIAADGSIIVGVRKGQLRIYRTVPH